MSESEFGVLEDPSVTCDLFGVVVELGPLPEVVTMVILGQMKPFGRGDDQR